MGWGMAAMAGASLLGGLASAKGQSDANAANLQIAREQMAFQERMSNTAHQREAKDLAAAGLNRILSGTGGAGASAPQGASAKMENEAAPLVASAMDALRTLSMAQLTQAQTGKTVADTDLSVAQTTKTNTDSILSATNERLASQNIHTAKAQERQLTEQTNLTKVLQHVNMAEIANKEEMNNLLKAQGVTEGMRARLFSVQGSQALEMLKTMKVEGEISETTFGKMMGYMKRAKDSGVSLKDAASFVKPGR